MFKTAYPHDNLIFYFDEYGNKYVAKGGNLAWRINNPGLIPSRSSVAKKKGAIGSYDKFAIFAKPEQGHQALVSWLREKKRANSPVSSIAEHYNFDRDAFSSHAGIPFEKPLKSLSAEEVGRLAHAIKMLCGYAPIGNESFSPLPKITAKIETGGEVSYLIGGDTVLSKTEAIEWILSHRLDALVAAGNLRNRPQLSIGSLRLPKESASLIEGEIETLLRVVGKRKEGQCIWGFINGIHNTQQDALESAKLISSMANGEAVHAMKNDTALYGFKDLIETLFMKLSIAAPIVHSAATFIRYLFSLSEHDKKRPPVILFAHSQGAIICERVLACLTDAEKGKLRIFTLGGGSFIPPGKCHPDSHNYASAADPVCRIGSPELQLLALAVYEGKKEGLALDQVFQKLAMRDAMLHIDSHQPSVLQKYVQSRIQHYQKAYATISNVTILDPDPGKLLKHRFSSQCYQNALRNIIRNYL